MSPTLRNILLTIMLAAVAGAGGAALGARYFAGRDRPAPAMHDVLHDELDLTADQERRLATIEARFADRRVGLEQRMRAANAELAVAMRASGRYGPEVRIAVEHFHGAMGDLQNETVLHIFEMRGLLTPAQAARFDQRVGEALTQDAQ